MPRKKTPAVRKAAVPAAVSRPSVAEEEPVCTVPGCDRPILHRGLCAEHWENPQA